MNDIMESILGVILAPINAACIMISTAAKLPVTLFIARDYNHEETVQRRGHEHTKSYPYDTVWDYVFYMIDQANATGRRIRYVFLDITIYASPSTDKKEVHRIVQKFYADSKRRDEKIRIQNSIVNFFFPRPKRRSNDIFITVREFERLMWPTPISGWGYP
ncbi:MAG: hypothetical protein HGB03_01780 [Candidatus Yonathbacteria bacterium]|nr:hypothetical protein [Candidatus Yonathbacteria bacterium]NTW47989.1 hypothetical protein [Candidatus Yonathbacteria bacterium]